MKLSLIVSSLLCFGCLNTQEGKTVHLFSDSKEASINNGFYIDSSNLKAIDTCGLKLNPISFWGESAWKLENHLFGIKKERLWFSNYFLHFGNTSPSITVKYKSTAAEKWETASKLLEPDLGYYLQIGDKPERDTILVSVVTTADSCTFYFIHDEKAAAL